MDDVSIITGCQVERFAATPSDIAAAIDRYYGNAEALRVAEQYTREKQEQAKARAALDPGSGNDENNVQQAPIVKLLGQIIEQAVHKRASDKTRCGSGSVWMACCTKPCGTTSACMPH